MMRGPAKGAHGPGCQSPSQARILGLFNIWSNIGLSARKSEGRPTGTSSTSNLVIDLPEQAIESLSEY